jgi:ABC-type lipoprotein release transport system permease subunit
LGIILTVSLETGIVLSVDTLYDDFILDHRNQNYTDITVHPSIWSDLSTLTDIAKVIRRVPGVVKASPVFYMSQFPNVSITNVLIYGIDSSTHPDYPYMNVTEGSRTVSGNTIVISEAIKNQAGVNVGDTANLADLGVGFNPRDVTIGGVIANTPFFGNKLGFFFILVDLDTLYEVFPENEKSVYLVGEIDVRVDNLINIRKISEKIKDKVGIGYYVFSEKDISEIEATGIRAYQTAMNLVIMASFVVEFLFITNVLAISIRDRAKEFGIVRAVGSGPYQLIESIALEILIYSAIGCTIGIGVGFLFSNVLVGILDAMYITLEFDHLSVHPSSIIATYLSGVLVALISGLYPIFLAISQPVVQNIHSQARQGTSGSRGFLHSWKYSLGAGILLSMVGFLLQFFVGPSRFLDFEILSIHFFTVVLIFVGTVLLEIGILVFLPKLAMKALFAFNIVSRTIATRNIAREFQKSLFTIMTSAMALAFIIVVGLVSAAVISGVPDYFQQQWGQIDVVAETRDTNPLHTNFTETLEDRPRIIRSSFIQEARTEIEDRNSYVFGVDPFMYEDFAEPVVDTLIEWPTHLILNQTRFNATYGVISHILYQRLHVPLGNNVSIKIADNSTVNVTLSAVIKSNVFIGGGEYLYISSLRFQEFYNSTYAKWFICDVDGDAYPVQHSLETSYEEYFKEVMSITFYTEMIEKSLVFQSAVFQVLFIESFILAAIAQFVCILVSTLRMEREIGVMRSFGLNRRGVFGIFMTESIALGITALIVGLIDGILGSILLGWYIHKSIPIDLSFSVGNIVIWLGFSFLITILSTFLPAYRSSMKNIVATISGRPMAKQYVEKDLYGYKGISQSYSISEVMQSPQIAPKNPFAHRIRSINDFPKDSHQLPSPPIARISGGVFSFIRGNKIEVQTVFLILMAIITFNYIFDESLIIRGLVSFDIFFPGVIEVFTSFIPPETPLDNNFLHLNPLLVFTGLATILPISHYLTKRKDTSSLFIFLIEGLIYGIGGTILLIISVVGTIAFFIIFYIILYNPLLQQIEEYGFSLSSLISESIPFISIAFVVILFVFFFVYHRIWNFIVFRGMDPNASFGETIRNIRTSSSSEFVKFTFLILLHAFLQNPLMKILSSTPTSYDPSSSSMNPFDLLQSTTVINPLQFLILAIYEVSFFLILIIFQIQQIRKRNLAYSRESVQPSYYDKKVNIELIKKSQRIADLILTRNSTGVNIQQQDTLIFSEVIDGCTLLFFQEASNTIPVAMNYTNNYPMKQAPISPESQLQIHIPSVDQMQRFIDFSNVLISD